MDIHPDWQRTSVNSGYVIVWCPDHPAAWGDGWVYEHRLVAEVAAGRFLLPNEIVHHRNHDKHDNRLGNLEIMDRGEHTAEHARSRPPDYVQLVCDQCGLAFERRANQRAAVKGYKRAYCTRICLYASRRAA